MMNWTITSYSPREYPTSLSDYTSTEIRIEPIGEMPIPLNSDGPRLPMEVPPMVLTVIDGEIRVVKDESPPGALLPNPASALFKLANTSTLMDSRA